MKKYKVVIIQRICAHYNLPLFQRLANNEKIDLILYYSKLRGDGKVANVNTITEFKNKKLFTIFLPFKKFPIFFHPGLFFHLINDKPNIIICEGESNIIDNIIVLLFSKIKHTPYVWWGLGRVRSNPPSTLRNILFPLIKYLLKNASAVLAYSTFAKEFYSAYGIDKNKIFVAYNCVDTELVEKNVEKYKHIVIETKRALDLSDKKVILFVGSFTKQKKIENLILAYKQIKLKHQNTALLLVGDGETRHKMEELVEKENIKDVVFVGQRLEDSSLYFLMGDVFVLPGEGGLAINQAMIHGLPIITVPADGTELDMVINGENGYIIEPNNIYALVQAINTIITNDQLRKSMGEKSKSLIEEKFNIQNMVNIILNCIDYCLNKSKNSSIL